VFDCIRKFSLILDSIDPEVKEQVLSQKASAQHFGFYWNIISAYDGKERKQYAINDTETCIWDNGSYLKSILKSNINFFSNIQIAQKKDEASSSSSATVTTSSQNLLKNIEEELAKRRKGEHPQDAIYFYEKVDVALISSFLDEYKEHLNNDCMVTRIQSYESALFYQKLLDEQAFIDVLKKTPRNILSLLLKTAGNTKNDRLIVAIIKAGYDFPKIITTDQAAWFSLLSAAIENRWINVCKAILEKPEIKLTATSAIHMAAKHGLTEIVEIIANKIINFDYKDDSNNNYTPLQYAAQYGHLDTVKFLVSKGAKINIDYISMHHQPVFLAAVKAHFAIAWFFIQNGAHFSLHPYGLTLMHFAAYHGNVDFAEQLCGINVGLHDFNEADQTPIFCAVLKHHLNMVKFFIKYGVSVNDTYSKKTPSLLLLAAYNNDTNIIKVLLQAGAHINIAGDVNYMPLHYCAARGNLEVTQLFVEHHADLYAISSNGYTPLDLALKYNMIAVSEFLMSKMDFEVLSNMIPHRNKKYFKDNALFLAASKCPPRILEALINKGLNPAAVNVQKETAFHSAVASNNIDGLIFLIQNAVNKPADYEIKDSKGNTPLARAIINGLPLCVEALLKAGAQLPEKIDNIPLSEFIQKKLAEPNANQTIWTRLKMIIANKESAGVSFDALMLSCQTGREVQIDEEETDDHTQIASAQGTLNLAN
ncbi:MAG: ankyrin repeat domain-containing protein, partial [Gammaproteobacteria bacterium]